MAVYDIGDVVRLTWKTYDPSGNPVNPGSVSVAITDPSGNITNLDVVNTSTGNYLAVYTPNTFGRFVVYWYAELSNEQAFSDTFDVRNFDYIPIIGYDEALAHLNIPASSANEDEVRRFIDAASDLAEQYCGLVLGRRNIEGESYDGGNDYIRIRQPRVLTVTNVWENGVALNSDEYVVDPTGQRIYRLGGDSLTGSYYYGYFKPGAQNIMVSYVAGYIQPPAAARQGVLEILRHLWQTQRGGMNILTRNQTGDDFYPASTYSLPRRAMELLDPVSLPGIA